MRYVAFVTLVVYVYFTYYNPPNKPSLQTYYSPLKSLLVTSGFGKRGKEYHTGVDYSAAHGTEVYSPCNCSVVTVSYNGRLGKHVVLKDYYGLSFTFAHLSTTFVHEGDVVSPHVVLGKVGNSGYSFGPHLHFEVHYNNVYFNPSSLYLLHR